MAKRYSRKDFLARLREEIGRGRPLVMTGAGNGIAAKFIEQGGVDIIGVYNTGYFRMQGYGSLAGMLPMADANEMVYRIGRREVLPQVQKTPVIAGINGVDVLRDMSVFLEDLGILALLRVSFLIVVAVIRNAVNEEQTQHLKPLGAKLLFLVQVLFDGLPNLEPLVLCIIYLTYSLPKPHDFMVAGEADVFVALLHRLWYFAPPPEHDRGRMRYIPCP